jgi:hypothetical protein
MYFSHDMQKFELLASGEKELDLYNDSTFLQFQLEFKKIIMKVD